MSGEVGEHLLGHVLLKHGGFSEEQREKLMVATKGSIRAPDI